jgi:hypothetical protein
MGVHHDTTGFPTDDGTSLVSTDEYGADHVVSDIWEGGGRMTVSETPPVDPSPGDVWIDTST